MRNLIAATAVMAGIACCGPAMAQDAEIVGYSAAQRAGNAGLLVFHDDCDNSFPGIGARACTTADLLRGAVVTRPVDPNPNSTNWVLPSIVGIIGANALDASGRSATPANLTCDSWRSNSAAVTGITLNDLGQIVLAACNGARNITCCAPPAP